MLWDVSSVERMESLGIQPLLDFLKISVGDFPLLSRGTWNADHFDWFSTIRRTRQYNAAIFLIMSAARDSEHPKKNLLQFASTALSLSSRKHYFVNSSAPLRSAYMVYMSNLTLLLREQAGFVETNETIATVQEDLEDIFAFEKTLAEVRPLIKWKSFPQFKTVAILNLCFSIGPLVFFHWSCLIIVLEFQTKNKKMKPDHIFLPTSL